MEFGEGHIFDATVVDDKDVVAGLFKLVKVETDGFVDAATDAVAANGGLVDFFRDDNGEAGFTASVVAEDKTDVGVAEGFALMIDIFDTTSRVEPVFFR